MRRCRITRLPNFNFEVKEQRGDIRLVQEPSRRNGFGAVVRIRDSSGGQGRYHFRLSWDMRVAEPRGDDRRARTAGL